MKKQRIIVGISGASGAIYGLCTLIMLRQCNIESHLIVSKSAILTIRQELGLSKREIYKEADVVYSIQDIGAAIASGSFITMGMLVVPCSIKTMSEIRFGFTKSLMVRSADVILKERRRIVLMVRETPLHIGHLQTMIALTQLGAIIMPPVPAFYTQPKTIHDLVNHTVSRALDLFGIEIRNNFRWSGFIENSNKKMFLKPNINK